MTVVCAGGFVLLSSAAGAGIRHGTTLPVSTYLQSGEATRGPLGFYGLCNRDPEICRPGKAQGAGDEGHQLTAAAWSKLVQVNQLINARIRPLADHVRHGIADMWTIDPAFGDCEDYALTKRKQLLAAGWPASALLVAVVRDENAEPHAVLIARTGKGDFVLDNRRARVMPWSDLPYRWVKIQSGDNPRQWVKLAGYGAEMVERRRERIARIKARMAVASAARPTASLTRPITQLPRD